MISGGVAPTSQVDTIREPLLFQQFVKNIGIPVVHGPSIARVPRIACIARIARTPDIAEIAHVLVYDHILVKFTYV
jgi:hypothetical protein